MTTRPSRPVRLLIADDHAIVRAGLVALVAGDDRFDVVAEASTAHDAVERARIGDIDVVLMDLRFAGVTSGIASGVEATRSIRALESPPQVLIVTSYDTDTEILGAVEAGACGYLLKDTPPDHLLAAIAAAADGQSALSPTVAAALLGRLRDGRVELSGREIEVLGLVGRGLGNRQIAAELHVSEATVKSHLVHIFDKLDVASRTAAAAKGRDLGLI